MTAESSWDPLFNPRKTKIHTISEMRQHLTEDWLSGAIDIVQARHSKSPRC